MAYSSLRRLGATALTLCSFSVVVCAQTIDKSESIKDGADATKKASVINNALKVDGSAVTQPVSGIVTANAGTGTFAVSGTVTTNPPSHASTNVDQVNGTTIDTNSGNKSAGTQRVVLATDQPPLTNALKVDGSAVTQPVSGSVTANQGGSNWSINEAQVGGTAIDTNSGLKSAGTQRFVLATDQPQLTNALKVDGSAVTQPVSGTVTTTPPSHASTNVDQVAGNAIDTNSGNKSAGTQRVVLATDQPQLANALKVDGSTVTQPVSGTVTANQGGSNWSTNEAQIGGTAIDTNSGNKSAGTQRVILATDQPQLTNALKVDGSAVTQPVSGNVTANAGSGTFNVTQNAATSTSATLQNAVTANGNGSSLTVDGDAAAVLTVNCASCSGGTTVNFEVSEDNSNYTAMNAVQVGTNTIASSTTAAGVTVWEVPVAGMQKLRARISGYSAGTITVTGHADPVTYSGKVVNANVVNQPTVTANAGSGTFGTNTAQVGGTAIDTNSGNKSAGTQRVILATDQPQLTNALKIDGSAVTQPVSGTVTTSPPSNASTNVTQWNGTTVDTNSGNKSAGTVRVVLATDQPTMTNAQPVSQNGTWTVQPGNTANTTPWLIQTVPQSTGGWSKVKYTAQTTTVQTVKSSAGVLGGWYIYNPNSAAEYVQIFDNSGTVTLGTTTPDLVLGIPANSGANILDASGINFANAIKLGCTTTETGSAAPATGLTVNIFYK
jgi:hypothetical protein